MKAVNEQVVEPYARALMSVAQGNNLTEQFGEDVRSLLNVLQTSEQFRDFLANPFINAEDKKADRKSVV